jgi:putative salt-induced outer membrane protein YdiY
VTRNTNRETTAENYNLRGRVNRTITDRFFYYGGAGWERNTFAGFNARVVAEAGAGNMWANSDATRFDTNYGLTYTVQDDVIENPGASDSFAGLRVGGDFWKQLTSTTAFESLVILDQSFSKWEAFRADWTNAVSVDISGALALKAGLQLLFNNEPSLTTVALEQPAGTPTGETVLVPLEKLDTVFTIALVADF